MMKNANQQHNLMKMDPGNVIFRLKILKNTILKKIEKYSLFAQNVITLQ